MISHDGITASIISKGAPLLETTIDPNNPMLAFCEAKLGEEFRVNVKGKMPSHHDVVIRCYMDGIWVGGSCYRRKKHKDYSATFRGVKLPNDTSKLQPFKFSGIQLTGQHNLNLSFVRKPTLLSCWLLLSSTLWTYRTFHMFIDDDKVAPINKKEIERLGTIKVELFKCLTRTRRLKKSEIKKSKEKESKPLELASKRVFAEGSKIIKKSHLVGCVSGLNSNSPDVTHLMHNSLLCLQPWRSSHCSCWRSVQVRNWIYFSQWRAISAIWVAIWFQK